MLSLGGTLVGYTCTIGYVISGKLFFVSRMGCEEYRSWFGSGLDFIRDSPGQSAQALETRAFAGFYRVTEQDQKNSFDHRIDHRQENL